jgi:hypothetical protein
MSPKNLFIVAPSADGSLLAVIEQAMAGDSAALAALPSLTNLALSDEFLARQIVAIHRQWELRPQSARGLLGRLRSRLAWWLLGPELQQANQFHATAVRLLDSLLVHLDAERAESRRIAEQIAYRRPTTDD